jgi:hypothetical protein
MRPDVEKYEAMALAARGDIVGYVVKGRGPAAKLVKEGNTAIPALCAYIHELEGKPRAEGGGKVTPKELKMLGWVIWLSALPLALVWSRAIGAAEIEWWGQCIVFLFFYAPFFVAIRLFHTMADRREKEAVK